MQHKDRGITKRASLFETLLSLELLARLSINDEMKLLSLKYIPRILTKELNLLIRHNCQPTKFTISREWYQPLNYFFYFFFNFFFICICFTFFDFFIWHFNRSSNVSCTLNLLPSNTYQFDATHYKYLDLYFLRS